jgi:hypothetical protein
MQPVLKMRDQNSQHQKSIVMKTLSINRILLLLFYFYSLHFYFPVKKKTAQILLTMELQNRMPATYSDESAQADESFDDIADVSMTAADADNTASTGRLNRDYHPDFCRAP